MIPPRRSLPVDAEFHACEPVPEAVPFSSRRGKQPPALPREPVASFGEASPNGFGADAVTDDRGGPWVAVLVILSVGLTLLGLGFALGRWVL